MYTAKDIRNLALLGHGGDGKSALCESMLYVTKATHPSRQARRRHDRF